MTSMVQMGQTESLIETKVVAISASLFVVALQMPIRGFLSHFYSTSTSLISFVGISLDWHPLRSHKFACFRALNSCALPEMWLAGNGDGIKFRPVEVDHESAYLSWTTVSTSRVLFSLTDIDATVLQISTPSLVADRTS